MKVPGDTRACGLRPMQQGSNNLSTCVFLITGTPPEYTLLTSSICECLRLLWRAGSCLKPISGGCKHDSVPGLCTSHPLIACCDADADPDVATELCEDDWGHVVDMTDGYSGSDMRNLTQEACILAVHDATKDEPLTLSPQDIRPVNLQDFQVS